MPTDADIPEDRSAPTQQIEDQEDITDTVIRLDPRDLHTIIQRVKADATSTSQSPSATHSFKREGFGRSCRQKRDSKDCRLSSSGLPVSRHKKQGVTSYPRATQETSVAVSRKRRIEEDPPAVCAKEKDTGPRNAQKVDKLLSTGAIQETGCDSHSLLHIHPLSVAKGPTSVELDGSSQATSASGLRHTLANDTNAQHRRELTRSLKSNRGKEDCFEVGQQRKRSTWEFIKLMLCRLSVGAH